MPSSNPDLKGRPSVEDPAVCPSDNKFQILDQDFQYAETLQNPLPEVVLSSPASTAYGTTPTSPVALEGVDGPNEAATENDARSSLHPGTAGSKEAVMREDVWVEPKEVPWYKAISPKKWATIVICTVGITGVVLAILGAMNKLSGVERSEITADLLSPYKTSAHQISSSSDTSSPTGGDTSSGTNITSTTPAASSKPTPTHFPSSIDKIDCADNSTFYAPVDWVGTTVNAYKTAFAQAASPAGCCAACESHRGGGCAGWLYMPGSDFTPCTKVLVSREQDDRGGVDDGTCPLGRVATTFFSSSSSQSGEDRSGRGTAGMGPCSLGGKLQQ
ncbi:hypothetical protein P885DRAFT_67593 [Corynascus similis CBS 632.67]